MARLRMPEILTESEQGGALGSPEPAVPDRGAEPAPPPGDAERRAPALGGPPPPLARREPHHGPGPRKAGQGREGSGPVAGGGAQDLRATYQFGTRDSTWISLAPPADQVGLARVPTRLTGSVSVKRTSEQIFNPVTGHVTQRAANGKQPPQVAVGVMADELAVLVIKCVRLLGRHPGDDLSHIGGSQRSQEAGEGLKELNELVNVASPADVGQAAVCCRDIAQAPAILVLQGA